MLRTARVWKSRPSSLLRSGPCISLASLSASLTKALTFTTRVIPLRSARRSFRQSAEASCRSMRACSCSVPRPSTSATVLPSVASVFWPPLVASKYSRFPVPTPCARFWASCRLRRFLSIGTFRSASFKALDDGILKIVCFN